MNTHTHVQEPFHTSSDNFLRPDIQILGKHTIIYYQVVTFKV